MVKNRLFYIPAILIPLIGIIFGTFYDWQISSSFAVLNNPFSELVASIGEFPLYGGLGLLGGLIISGSIRTIKNKGLKVCFHLAAVIGFLIGIYFQGRNFTSINAWNIMPPEVYGNFVHLLISMPFGMIIVIPFAVLGFFIGKKINDKRIIYTIIVIYCFVLLNVIIFNVIKIIVLRPRFRLLMSPILTEVGYNDPYQLYTPWYKPTDIFDEFKVKLVDSGKMTYDVLKENCKSFPSGHSASAAIAMLLFPLFTFIFPKIKKYDWALFLAGLLWTILVMFTRLYCGAHYMSDVCFGALIGVLSNIGANEFIRNKIYKKEI